MARASTVNALGIDRFAAVLGLDPLHINQIAHGICGSPMFQYAWQHPGRIGREDLALVINHAENLVFDELGFYPAPTWTEEVVALPTRAVRAILPTQFAGYFIEGGKESLTAILNGRPVVYSDADGDGIDETATITAATVVTDPSQIAVFYPGHGGDPEWEIKPISVSIVGGTATITCKRWLLVKSALQEALDPDENGVDVEDDPSFLATVDVWRRVNDPSLQAQFEGPARSGMWADYLGFSGWGCSGCSGSGCQSCTRIEQTACLAAYDAKLGILRAQPATWDATNKVFNSATWQCGAGLPARVRLWHHAGWINPTSPAGKMDPLVERAIAILAVSLLGEDGLCQCLATVHERWAEDLSFEESNTDGSRRYNVGRSNPYLQDSPFGMTRGAIEAWRLLRGIENG